MVEHPPDSHLSAPRRVANNRHLSTSLQTNLSADDVMSRPSSSAGMRVDVESVDVATARNLAMYPHMPRSFDEDEPLLVHADTRGHVTRVEQATRRASMFFVLHQTVAVLISSFLLLAVVGWGLVVRLVTYPARTLERRRNPIERVWDQDEPSLWEHEGLVKSPQYYARSCGFEIEDCVAETEDGYYLRVHRVSYPGSQRGPGKGYPVLIMHGLFQSSGSFITSEDRSIAFWLAKHGNYQVYLGNNRAVYDMGHRKYSRYDARFWDYNIHDLARYDIPALVDFVRRDTGYDKIAYIGHSQGNASAFLALSRFTVPELGEKLSYFAALAPAVYAGPLTSGFPFNQLQKVEWPLWQRMFGVLDFIPLMKFSYDYTPAGIYAALGYQMFAYLFQWTDTNWLHRRKPKMFRFTPQPVSSASLFWWAGKGGFCTKGCLFDQETKPWFDPRFPPLSLYGGGGDELVLIDPLIERLHADEPDVRVLRIKIQPRAEVSFAERPR